MTEATQKLAASNADDTQPPESNDEDGFFSVKFRLNERISELELECAEHRSCLEGLRQKLLDAEIGRQAALLGISPERAGHIAKLAKLDNIFDDNSELDNDALGSAIDEVLRDIPELRGHQRSGAFNPKGATVTKAELYRQQISEANAKGDLLSAVSLKRKAKNLGISFD